MCSRSVGSGSLDRGGRGADLQGTQDVQDFDGPCAPDRGVHGGSSLGKGLQDFMGIGVPDFGVRGAHSPGSLGIGVRSQDLHDMQGPQDFKGFGLWRAGPRCAERDRAGQGRAGLQRVLRAGLRRGWCGLAGLALRLH